MPIDLKNQRVIKGAKEITQYIKTIYKIDIYYKSIKRAIIFFGFPVLKFPQGYFTTEEALKEWGENKLNKEWVINPPEDFKNKSAGRKKKPKKPGRKKGGKNKRKKVTEKKIAEVTKRIEGVGKWHNQIAKKTIIAKAVFMLQFMEPVMVSKLVLDICSGMYLECKTRKGRSISFKEHFRKK